MWGLRRTVLAVRPPLLSIGFRRAKMSAADEKVLSHTRNIGIIAHIDAGKVIPMSGRPSFNQKKKQKKKYVLNSPRAL